MTLPHILLIDDDLDVLHTLGRVLGLFGLRITTAHRPSDALARITTSDEFDVVLTDWHMPGMSGIELARCIRGKLPHLPIVVTTGGVDELPDELGSAGVHLVHKPVRPNELAATLRRLAQRKP